MFGKNKEIECACDAMVVVAVDHEKIKDEQFTHAMKVCPKCKDWEVESVRGAWDKEQFTIAK